MSVKEIIDVLNQYIMGYAGYWTLEDRQDSMDVFVAWLHGRFSKKSDDYTSVKEKLKKNPDFQNFEHLINATFKNIEIILKHLKYDDEKIKPFLKEPFLENEKITDDLVILDDKAFQTSEMFCKKLEYLDGMTKDSMNEIFENSVQIIDILKARTERINTLNKLCFVLQSNVEQFCQNIHQTTNVDDIMFNKIFKMIEQFPNRIVTYEKILDALKTARPFYQNYSDKHTLQMKYEVYKSYLKNYPLLLQKAKIFSETFTPRGNTEKKCLENLKKAIDNPPDFENLNKKLKTSYEEL